ncbi:MAG: DsbE family thiol:disulfide interchange protein [Alphaproteobacteria bacterium]
MNREKLKTAIPFVIFGILVVVLLVGLHPQEMDRASATSLRVGASAPETNLPNLTADGTRFISKAWRGRPYIVNFFASWCSDCRAEHEELMTLEASHIPLIGITFKDRPDKISAYLDHAGNPYALVVQDEDNRASLDWGLAGVPETFVVDTHGIIRWHYAGILTDKIVTDELMPAWEASQAAR